jgi:hypothetical protein
MTARTAVDTDDSDGSSPCWCCGRQRPETRLLRLGARPEAAVCIDCVANLRQRARAHEDPPPVVRQLRRIAARLRRAVTDKGLHKQAAIGPLLRWVNRRSPF